MAKKIFLMMKKNSMTLLGAAILASGIFYVVNNPDVFMASVLSLQEQQFIAEKGWDIAYKTNDGYVDIFMAENMETPANLHLIISFNKDSVSIDPQNISGQGTRTYTLPDAENIDIESIPGTAIKKNESLIMVPFTGEIQDILLSEATIAGKGLSIGSLNEIDTHTK